MLSNCFGILANIFNIKEKVLDIQYFIIHNGGDGGIFLQYKIIRKVMWNIMLFTI